MEKARVPYLEIISRQFASSPAGSIHRIPLLLLFPTQPDDYHSTRTPGPIEACSDRGKIVILHGNHRYWQRKRNNNLTEELYVQKVRNPFIDY